VPTKLTIGTDSPRRGADPEPLNLVGWLDPAPSASLGCSSFYLLPGRQMLPMGNSRCSKMEDASLLDREGDSARPDSLVSFGNVRTHGVKGMCFVVAASISS
jgi:hypothetical protein